MKRIARATPLGVAILIGSSLSAPLAQAAYIAMLVQEGVMSSRPEAEPSTWPV